MKGEQELRCYTFTIYQLSSIQQGIQAGHAAVELFTKYPFTSLDFNMVGEWAHYWKTMVCLNAGDVSELRDLILFFSSTHNPYPWVPFYESEASLDGIPTSIAIILPAKIFETASALRKNLTPENNYPIGFSVFEEQLIELLNSTGLAR